MMRVFVGDEATSPSQEVPVRNEARRTRRVDNDRSSQSGSGVCDSSGETYVALAVTDRQGMLLTQCEPHDGTDDGDDDAADNNQFAGRGLCCGRFRRFGRETFLFARSLFGHRLF